MTTGEVEEPTPRPTVESEPAVPEPAVPEPAVPEPAAAWPPHAEPRPTIAADAWPTETSPIAALVDTPRRLGIAAGVAIGLLLVLFAGTVTVLNSTVYSASGFVSAYLHSLERHDVASIMRMPGVDADADASAVLLQREALGRLSHVAMVEDSDVGGGEHHVTFEYLIDGRPGQTTFVVQHAGAHMGFFNAWEFIESPLTRVEIVPRNAVQFEVNGVEVVAAAGAGEVNSYQVLVPGAYSIRHESLYLESEETVLPLTATGRVERYVLDVSASRAFVEAVQEELAAHLDRCAEQEVLQPTGCPFGKQVSNRLASTPMWDIAEYPRVEILPGEQVGTWLVPPAPGLANLEVDVRSLFDGSVASFDENVPFSVSFLVTFTADGGLTLTPR